MVAVGLNWIGDLSHRAAPAPRPLTSSRATALGNEPCDLADEPYLPPAAACGHVAINDFDGDGLNDRFYTYVLRGRAYARARLGSGRVTPSLDLGAGIRGRVVRAVDFDSDGRAEAWVLTGSGPMTLEVTESPNGHSRVYRSESG